MTDTSTRRPGRRWPTIALQLLGLAGLAGVAATGVLVTRDQRRRSALTPDQVRERLRTRYAEATSPWTADPRLRR